MREDVRVIFSIKELLFLLKILVLQMLKFVTDILSHEPEELEPPKALGVRGICEERQCSTTFLKEVTTKNMKFVGELDDVVQSKVLSIREEFLEEVVEVFPGHEGTMIDSTPLTTIRKGVHAVHARKRVHSS